MYCWAKLPGGNLQYLEVGMKSLRHGKRQLFCENNTWNEGKEVLSVFIKK